MRLPPILRALICVALSAPLIWAGTGLHPHWWMLWIALLPLFWFAGREGDRRHAIIVAVATFLAWLIGSLNQWSYLRNLIGLPLGLTLIITVVPALLLAVAVLLWRRLLLRGRILTAALFLPAFWVTLEYLNAITSPHSTWSNLAYTQSDFLPLIQIASLTGVWGIEFVVFLVISTAGILLSPVPTRQQKWLAAGMTAAVALPVFAFGAWRLAQPLAETTTGTLHVRLVSDDVRNELFATSDAKALHVLGRYADTISASTSTPGPTTTASTTAPDPAPAPANAPVDAHAALAAHADVIVVPEKLARVSETAAPTAKGLFENAARRTDALVIVGLDEDRHNTRRNEALVFDHTGALTIDYEKHHFIPVLEDGYVPGTTYETWPTPNGTLGVAICKDMDFPDLGREYGARGVGLLFVPAWDFDVDGWYHSRMAIMRGVESGFSIARVAKLGLQTVTDNRGHLLVDRPGSPDGFVTSDVIAPVAHADTLYTRWGDWFADLAIAGLAWTLWVAFRAPAHRAIAFNATRQTMNIYVAVLLIGTIATRRLTR